MSWFRKKKEENYTTDYVQGSGDNTIVMRGHYHDIGVSCSGSVSQFANRYLNDYSFFTPEQIRKMESPVWDSLGHAETWFECLYCRSRFSGNDAYGLFCCPQCGAPVARYVKGI